jgi:hypothetical protein
MGDLASLLVALRDCTGFYIIYFFFVIDVKTEANFRFSTLIQICYIEIALNFVAK